MSLLDSEIKVIDKMSIKDFIIEWLGKYRIDNYKINNDLTIDVDDNVDLYEYSESQLPDYIQFNEVNGWFDISNSQIETLKGSPEIVNNSFNCSRCAKLKTLKGAPGKVDGSFYCSACSKLETLEGAPKIINGGFDCSFCEKLKTLKGAPKKVNGSFGCSACSKLKITESDYKKYRIIK